jgi:hypothetical protein
MPSGKKDVLIIEIPVILDKFVSELVETTL